MENEQIWADFFQAAITFRDLKPWEWMYDSDTFAVEDPDTGEVNYCCVMGHAGEVFALGLYLGKSGYNTYLKLAHLSEELPFADSIALGLEQEMLKVEFVNRDELHQKDRDLVKALGLKFRGRNQWILAREHRPGYYPWFITAEQARILTHAMVQAMDVAIRYEENESLIFPDDTNILIRRPAKENGKLVWRDEYEEAPTLVMDPEDTHQLSKANQQRAQKLDKVETAMLFMLQYLPTPVKEHGDAPPHFPKIALWLDYGSGMIIRFELLSGEFSAQTIEDYFFDLFEQMKYIPEQIGVNSIMAYQQVRHITDALEIELMLIPEEPIFEDVMESFTQFM